MDQLQERLTEAWCNLKKCQAKIEELEQQQQQQVSEADLERLRGLGQEKQSLLQIINKLQEKDNLLLSRSLGEWRCHVRCMRVDHPFRIALVQPHGSFPSKVVLSGQWLFIATLQCFSAGSLNAREAEWRICITCSGQRACLLSGFCAWDQLSLPACIPVGAAQPVGHIHTGMCQLAQCFLCSLLLPPGFVPLPLPLCPPMMAPCPLAMRPSTRHRRRSRWVLLQAAGSAVAALGLRLHL
jgi:hypothetical protein